MNSFNLCSSAVSAICSMVDQKPWHENQSESSGRGTLCWKGMPRVGLKSNVAASRSRTSISNMATDDPDFEPFVEQCFKLGTDRCVKALRVPEGVRMSLTHSESGSYDAETFMNYLRRWLPLWTAERAADADYRIFLLDDYRVHNMPCVREILWERGFFRVRIAPLPLTNVVVQRSEFVCIGYAVFTGVLAFGCSHVYCISLVAVARLHRLICICSLARVILHWFIKTLAWRSLYTGLPKATQWTPPYEQISDAESLQRKDVELYTCRNM
jgi:hypothetical protein